MKVRWVIKDDGGGLPPKMRTSAPDFII